MVQFVGGGRQFGCNGIEHRENVSCKRKRGKRRCRDEALTLVRSNSPISLRGKDFASPHFILTLLRTKVRAPLAVTDQYGSILHLLPTLNLRAGEDGIADSQFIMAILEGAEIRVFARATDEGIDAQQEVLEAVGVSFGVPAGIMGVGASAFAEQRGVFHQ